MKNHATASHDGVKAVPVKKYKIPEYPTHAEAFGDQELLRKLPPSWMKNAAVTTAAGLLGAFALASYAAGSGNETPQNGGSHNTGNLLKVAPIFEHGVGTGSLGCVMVAPSRFLSEQEALAIIKNTAEEAGIFFNDPPPGYTAATDTKVGPMSVGYGRVGLDLFDAKKGIAASFIAMSEAEVKIDGFQSSSTSFRARELAGMAAVDFARQNGDIAVGVFYDPGVSGDGAPVFQFEQPNQQNPGKITKEHQDKYLNEAADFLEKQLRAQVRDFIEWLQAQGII